MKTQEEIESMTDDELISEHERCEDEINDTSSASEFEYRQDIQLEMDRRCL